MRRPKEAAADGGGAAEDEEIAEEEPKSEEQPIGNFWDEIAKVLTFAMSLVTAFSIRDAIEDSFADTPGWNDLVRFAVALNDTHLSQLSHCAFSHTTSLLVPSTPTHEL